MNMNKYLHLGTLVAALAAGCASNSAVVEPASPAGSVTKPTEPVKTAESQQQPKEEFKQPHVCDNVELKDGAYKTALIMPATYYVRENATKCGLLLEKRLNVLVLYTDLGCDNTMDFGYSDGIRFSRDEVAKEGGGVNFSDTALKLGQSFVCEENRINYDDDKYQGYKNEYE